MIINFKSNFYEEGFCEGNITTNCLSVAVGEESLVTINYTGKYKEGQSQNITLKTVCNKDDIIELVSPNMYCRMVHIEDDKHAGTYIMTNPFDRGVLFQ